MVVTSLVVCLVFRYVCSLISLAKFSLSNAELFYVDGYGAVGIYCLLVFLCIWHFLLLLSLLLLLFVVGGCAAVVVAFCNYCRL